MSLRINFAGVDVGAREAKPNGWYNVRVTDAEVRESKSEKNPGMEYWNYELTITDGQYEGQKFFVNAMLMEKALFTLKAMMAASGKWTKEQLEGELEVDMEDLLGCEFQVKNVQRKYQEEMTDNIRQFKALGEKTSSNGASPASSLMP